MGGKLSTASNRLSYNERINDLMECLDFCVKINRLDVVIS